MSKAIQSKGWFPCLEKAIASGELPSFPTKRAAEAAGKVYGWKTALKVSRRFETIWLVGKEDFQPDYELDIEFRVLRLPLLRWDTVSGVKQCPVLKVRAPRDQ